MSFCLFIGMAIALLTKVGSVVYRTRALRTLMTGFTPFPDNRTEQGRDARHAAAAAAGPASSLRDAVLPAAIIAVVCVGAAVYALTGNESAHVLREVLGIVIVGMALMVAVAYFGARAASR